MTLPAWEYGDPEKVASRRQGEAAQKEKACGQCRERGTAQWQGEQLVFCGIRHQTYGRRCEHFRKSFKRGENDN